MRERFVKLVRDKIPQFVGDSTVVYKPIEDESKRIEALRKKLVEEAIEFLMNPSTEELADVLEVCEALEWHDPAVSANLIKDYRGSKRAERGGFDDSLGMYVMTTAGAEHEGEHA